MRILFMGTPDIAAECLKALYAAGHDICAVYTRRDKPVGRKQVLTAPPVKEVALVHGTPVFQPRTLRDGSEDANIRALAPELIVVVAYGCILPKSVLELPKYGCINLHVSLLPKYRGSAPVQWSVLNGDAETGVSIMQMDEGLDTGDVLRCEKIAIGPEETSGELFDRVTAVGARVLCEVVPAIAAGTLTPQPQDHANATLAPMLNNNDIFNSKKILFNISFSTKSELMMEEMNEVHDFMSKFGKDVETKWGLYIDESLEEQVKFTVLATGFGIKDVPGMDNMMNKRTIEEQKKLEELEEEEQRKDERRGDYYGKDTFKNSNKKKRHNIYIFSLEDLDNDDIISMVETTPTFQRTKTVLESIQSKAIAEEEETFNNNDTENGGITITF